MFCKKKKKKDKEEEEEEIKEPVNKMEKIIELYEESHLPIKGWLQCCMLCGAKTSRVIEFKRVETKHMIYIIKMYYCKDCKHHQNIKKEEHINFINKYIDANYLLPC
tara:strand:- start:2990 stop:3310 length:321 start_codon:yes stop_codon:yes gene_type:complete